MKIQIEKNGRWTEVTKREFLEMVRRGDIRPETEVQIDEKIVKADQIKGLAFFDAAEASLAADDKTAAFFQAAREGNNARLKTLLDGGVYVNAKDEGGLTALHLAAAAGHEPTVDFLLKNDANIAAQDKYGRTALFEAAGAGHTDVVIYLVAKGLSVAAKDKQGRTLVHVAAEGGHVDTIQTLRGYDLSLDQPDDQGMTPLHDAAAGGHTKAVDFLLKNGMDIEKKDSTQRTALFIAAEKGWTETVALLLSKGSRSQTRNADSKTPMMVAVENSHAEFVRLLAPYEEKAKPIVLSQEDKSRIKAHEPEAWEITLSIGCCIVIFGFFGWCLLYTLNYGTPKDHRKLAITAGVISIYVLILCVGSLVKWLMVKKNGIKGR